MSTRDNQFSITFKPYSDGDWQGWEYEIHKNGAIHETATKASLATAIIESSAKLMELAQKS